MRQSDSVIQSAFYSRAQLKKNKLLSKIFFTKITTFRLWVCLKCAFVAVKNLIGLFLLSRG